MMAKKAGYLQYLKDTLSGLVDRLDLTDLRKDFLKNRWLDQLLWLESRATKEQKQHYLLRLITIIGGVLVPVLVSFRAPSNERLQNIVSLTALGISQTVAISAALEEFFGHGEKYRNYRNTAEGLKIEGWQFFQLAGPYHSFKTHEEAYTHFAQRVEQYVQQDVQGFLTQLESRQEGDKKKDADIEENLKSLIQKLDQRLEASGETIAETPPRDAQG